MYIISKIHDYNFVKGKKYFIKDMNRFECLVVGEHHEEWISKNDTKYYEYYGLEI